MLSRLKNKGLVRIDSMANAHFIAYFVSDKKAAVACNTAAVQHFGEHAKLTLIDDQGFQTVPNLVLFENPLLKIGPRLLCLQELKQEARLQCYRAFLSKLCFKTREKNIYAILENVRDWCRRDGARTKQVGGAMRSFVAPRDNRADALANVSRRTRLRKSSSHARRHDSIEASKPLRENGV